MTANSGNGDYYSPEEKQRIHEEWLDSERGQSYQRHMKWKERKASVVAAAVWIVVGFLALVVGLAVLRCAIGELTK